MDSWDVVDSLLVAVVALAVYVYVWAFREFVR